MCHCIMILLIALLFIYLFIYLFIRATVILQFLFHTFIQAPVM